MNYCLYHAHCVDGITAAAIVANAIKDVICIPVSYGEPLPIMESPETVYIVDFSYDQKLLHKIAEISQHVVWLDHHKSAIESVDLSSLPENVTHELDVNRSGAGIAWDYFYPNENMPPIVAAVQDRDLWRFDLDHTREIYMSISQATMDVSLWKLLIHDNDAQHIRDGELLLNYLNNMLYSLYSDPSNNIMPLKLAGHIVPAVNCNYMFASELGNKLSQNEEFSATYFISTKGVKVSLRSCVGGADVSEIAKQYGGGGHYHAAGFTVSTEKFFKEILDY